jgi:hypothetical protein
MDAREENQWEVIHVRNAAATPLSRGPVRLAILGLSSALLLSGCGGSYSAPPPTMSVSVSPKRAAITTGQTQTFSVSVTSTSNMNVNWDVDSIPNGNSTVGTIDASGKYTPPPTGGTHTITATSIADITKSASATLAVTDLAGVFTYHNDISRTGANTKEYALTTSTVNTTTFGKRFSCTVDAAIYAQPLWVANLMVGGAPHNVVFVATERDTLYAFDADANPCTTLWKTGANGVNSLIPAGELSVTSSDMSCGDLAPDIGITGTPVIDPATGTLYLVTKTKNTAGTVFHQRLHALNILTGSEKFSGPMDVAATVSGTGGGSSGGMLSFDNKINAQRPALLLETGHVIVSWASHCDRFQYHGWVISYNAGTLAREAVYAVAPNGVLSGIWMSGNGPAVDASGNLYFSTGNGTFDANTGGTSYGDSIVKLGPPAAGTFPVLSSFTPLDQLTLEGNDTDLGSGGLLLLPDLPSGAHTQLLLQAGKDGRIFLADRTSLGGFNSGSNNVVQQVSGQIPGGMWGSPAYWNGNLYFGAAQDGNSSSDPLRAFSFNASNSGLISTSPTSQSAQIFGFSGPTPSVSSSGNTNGILWALDNGNRSSTTGQVLYGYDATNLSNMLYNSTQAAGGRDSGGAAVKFSVPTVANGKVYVGGQTTLTVYGLLP